LLNLTCPSKPTPTISRVIDDHSVKKFVELLSYESWDAVFSNDNTRAVFFQPPMGYKKKDKLT
jgi:hypothetical protein